VSCPSPQSQPLRCCGRRGCLSGYCLQSVYISSCRLYIKSIMRACLETQKLEQLEARMDEIADRIARDRTNAARERTSTHEAQRSSH
jgi:hypothetical protein